MDRYKCSLPSFILGDTEGRRVGQRADGESTGKRRGEQRGRRGSRGDKRRRQLEIEGIQIVARKAIEGIQIANGADS